MLLRVLEGAEPFDVELGVAERALRAGDAGARRADEQAVLHAPLRGLALRVAPVLVHALLRAVEEDDRVGRRLALRCLHLLGVGTVEVVHRPGVLGVWRVSVQAEYSTLRRAGAQRHAAEPR